MEKENKHQFIGEIIFTLLFLLTFIAFLYLNWWLALEWDAKEWIKNPTLTLTIIFNIFVMLLTFAGASIIRDTIRKL